jgi:hypothetical protein
MTHPKCIERASNENVGAIVDFVYKIFGYSYVDPGLYDPAQILRFEREGVHRIFVCTGPDKAVHGLLVLAFSFPTKRILEISELLIDPDIGPEAGGQIIKQFIETLRQEFMTLAAENGLRTVVSLEVTEHRMTQRLSLEMGFVTAGVYLGYGQGWKRQLRRQPLERTRTGSSPGADSGLGRRTMVVSARPFRSKTPRQQVNLPGRFAGLIRDIYRDFRLQVEFVPPVKVTGAGRIETSVDFNRGRCIIEVHCPGEDTAECLLRHLQHFHSGFIELVHIILPLSGDYLDRTVEALAAASVSFAAVLPDYRQGPVLIMQSIDRSCLAPVKQDLLSERARHILANLMDRGGGF